MSWRVDGRVAKQNGRAKSVDKSGKLPPAITQESRERAEALRKAYERPKTAFRNNRPDTGNIPSLPGFSRSNSAKRASTALSKNMKRSQSESRNLLKMIDYGRSPSKEKLNDLRDELHEAKKRMMTMEVEKKRIQTQMHRVLRDSEKREKYLERLVTSKFQPAEMNDTHMARTLTAIQRNEINREHIIRMQAKELEALKKSLAESKSLEARASSSNEDESESDMTEQSDYPEEPEQIKSNGILKKIPDTLLKLEKNNNVTPPPIVGKEKEKEKEKIIDSEKMRKKLELAKAYADQNAKLKDRLKELKQNYIAAQQKNKEKENSLKKQSSNHLEENKKVTMQSQELLTTVEQLKNENVTLKEEKNVTKEQIDELTQELREAYGEIDALKMENEHLHDLILDLESRYGSTSKPVQLVDPIPLKNEIHIPKLNMNLIDSRDESSILSDSSARSRASITNIDQTALASALAEILGAHAERICIASRTY